jgi:hypothetical protein
MVTLCSFLGKTGEGGAIVRYGEIERAIASLHFVTEQSSGVFRGRLRHFQRLGIVPSSPGRGAKIDYDRKAAVDWAIAFELAELGIQPDLIKHFIERCGHEIFDFFEQPTPDGEDRFLCFDAAFLTMHMNRHTGAMLTTMTVLVKPLSGLPDFFGNSTFSRCGSVINLSRLKRQLGEALGIDDWA